MVVPALTHPLADMMQSNHPPQGIPEAQLQLLPALLPNTELLQSQGVLDTLRSPGENCEAHADALLEVKGRV